VIGINNILKSLADKATGRILSKVDLCIAHEFHKPPYGGGNQFCLALSAELERRGYRVSKGLSPATAKACLFNSYNFDESRLLRLRGQFTRLVHRVDGPIDVYRGNSKMEIDKKIQELNALLADNTVFQSNYSYIKHKELGLEFVQPIIIQNAVDPAFFHSNGRISWDLGRKTRLITVNWSDNPNKGGVVLQRMELMLDWGKYEWIHLGRTKCTFKHIKVVPPVGSEQVAEYLRTSDIMVTASLYESCSNVILEALACGLPVAYVCSGSNGELVQKAGCGFSTPEEGLECLHAIRENWPEYFKRIRYPSLDEITSRYEEVLFAEK